MTLRGAGSDETGPATEDTAVTVRRVVASIDQLGVIPGNYVQIGNSWGNLLWATRIRV